MNERQKGNWEQAIDYLNRFLQTRRAQGRLDLQARAYTEIETCYQNLGKDEAALNAHRKALKCLKEKYARDLIEYARKLDSAERPDKALVIIKKAIRLVPNESWPWFEEAVILEKAEYYDLANNIIDKAIELDPKQGHYHIVKAEILTKLGRIEEARDELEEALAFSLGDPRCVRDLFSIYKRYFTILVELGEAELAIEFLMEIRKGELLPEDLQYLYKHLVSLLVEKDEGELITKLLGGACRAGVTPEDLDAIFENSGV